MAYDATGDRAGGSALALICGFNGPSTWIAWAGPKLAATWRWWNFASYVFVPYRQPNQVRTSSYWALNVYWAPRGKGG